MQRSILILSVVAVMVMLVVLGCVSTETPTPAVPPYDPRTPALDLSWVKPVDVCGYVRQLDRSMTGLNDAMWKDNRMFGSLTQVRQMADEMTAAAVKLEKTDWPKLDGNIDAQLAGAYRMFADGLRASANGDLAALKTNYKAAQDTWIRAKWDLDALKEQYHCD